MFGKFYFLPIYFSYNVYFKGVKVEESMDASLHTVIEHIP